MAQETQHENAEPILGQYALLGEIGRGGMGVVFKARHLKLGRLVALKLLPIGVLASSGEVARFHQEMEAIGRLDHKNIVRAHDAGENEAGCFLAMEYLDGADLAHLVRSAGRLPVAAACGLIRAAALGLQHAHECELMHRDVKPSNLFLTKQGALKVLDFGLARFQHRPEEDGLTRPGCVVGTVDYMAPEQASASTDLDIRADIYSLGCTLYCLLVGSAPFAGEKYDSALKKINAHAQETPRPPSTVRDDVPDEVQRILDRTMAKQPDQRFSTPEEVASALAPFAGTEEIEELSQSIKPRPVTPVNLHDDWRLGDATTKSFQASSTQGGNETSRLRRSLLDRRTWIAAVSVSAAAAAVAVAVPYFSNHETTPPPSAPRWWREAFGAPPQPVHWPSPLGENDWKFLKDANQSLQVITKDERMLGFGEMPDGEFEFTIRIQQIPWEGRFGFFFGSQPVEVDDKACLRMQMLVFTLQEKHDAECIFRIYRKNALFQPYQSERFVKDFERSQSVRIHTQSAVDLTLRMNRLGWQGLEIRSVRAQAATSSLTELTSENANSSMIDKDYPMRGGWGIYCDRVVTLFSNARLS